MKGFEFRLQRILDLARRKTDLARREVGAALNELRDAEEREEASRAEERTLAEEMAEYLSGGRAIDPVEIRQKVECQRALAARSRRLAESVEAAERAWDEARERMIEQRRDVLGLEQLRESAWEAWRVDREREELAAMEEVAMRRHAWRSVE